MCHRTSKVEHLDTNLLPGTSFALACGRQSPPPAPMRVRAAGPALCGAGRGGHGGGEARRLAEPSRSLAGSGGAWLRSCLCRLRKKTCERVGFDLGEVTERPFLPCCALHTPPHAPSHPTPPPMFHCSKERK